MIKGYKNEGGAVSCDASYGAVGLVSLQTSCSSNTGEEWLIIREGE